MHFLIFKNHYTLVLHALVLHAAPRKRNAKGKWLRKEALQIAEKRRKAKGKGEKERYSHLNAEFQRTARRGKKAFLSEQ